MFCGLQENFGEDAGGGGAHCEAFFPDGYVFFVSEVVLFCNSVVPREEFLPGICVNKVVVGDIIQDFLGFCDGNV